MVDRHYKMKNIKVSLEKITSLLIILLTSLIIISCQQSSEDSSVSTNEDVTAPTTTVSVAGGCTLTGLTISGCTAAPIPVTFTADETATIYYAQGASSGVSVSTSSSSVTSGGSINVAGAEGSTVYVAFFAQDAAGNSETARELTITIPDLTAPVTTVAVGGGCTLAGLTINNCATTTIPVTFTADESATIYYAQGASPGVTVNTSSSFIDSDDSIIITGTEGDVIYVGFFAQDPAGNSETTRELTITIPDITDPVTAFSLVGGLCSNYGNYLGFIHYVCKGSTNVILTITDNTATTIYYDVTSDSTVTPTTASNTYGTGISIDTNDSYLTYYAEDAFGNEEVIQKYYFEIDGLSISGTSGGYYSSDQTFQFVLDASRDTPNGLYQLWYLEKTGTDVSADSTADVDSVFTSGTSPTPNASGTEYLDSYPLSPDPTSDFVIASTAADTTSIYQYKFNIIYDGTQDVSTDTILNGSVDIEKTLVLFIDKDKPKIMPIPPSSGSLNSTIQVKPHLLDIGHRLIDKYGTTNPNLFLATPQDFAETKYCLPTPLEVFSTHSLFWDFCKDNFQTLASGGTLTIDLFTQLGLTGLDAAGNKMSCDGAGDNQYTCQESIPVGTRHFAETYTPGMLQSSYYHENNIPGSDLFVNFGHSVATGDLDSDGTNDILVVGAPAYMYTDGSSANIKKGAVYVWYNGFRERALIGLIDNDVLTDVTNHVMVFKTDSYTAMSVYLDPSADTSGAPAAPAGKYQADSTDYVDKTQATASEIASVLNDAFLSSFGETYQNYLYADASTDGKLSIGHINQDLQGSFTYSSTFGPASGMYYSGSDIKAYDYVIYGENDGDEFGYSVAIGQVDTSTDTATYAASQLVVGAPGFGGVVDNDEEGALYVIRIPTNDASADYGTVTLADSTTDAHIIHATTGNGRLGHAITLYDNDSDGYNDIYVSAPYYDVSYQDGGAIYRIDEQIFSYNDTPNDISSDASDSYIWKGTNGSGTYAVDALFGYSLKAGHILRDPYDPDSQFLYIGTPGLIDSPSMPGRVVYFDIRPSIVAVLSFNDQLRSSYIDPETYSDASAETNFGHSLEIADSGFDTSGTSKCPCLVVGAPLAGNNTEGKVWILGKTPFTESVIGENTDDRIGTSLLADKLWSYDSIFIGGRGADDEGLLMIADKQLLTNNSNITAGLNTNIMTTQEGDNTGKGLAIISIDGQKALIMGLAGGTGFTNRIGRVRIYSPARLTP